ncbi:MAG: dTDP-4-dehydrorhamnose reductase [Spirulinaceae cyanobacterium RM2_2_10]|nr:dTDP-4-dehydrorhamnose reductase [Spirulinaceae cyanobacterium RM2_2_10]
MLAAGLRRLRVRPVLLLGKTGQLGQALARYLAAGDRPWVALSRADLDLAQPAAIAPVIQAIQPAEMINAAAYTAVDRAEQEPELAQAINGRAPGILAEIATQLGVRLTHISTDYVFDGRQGRPYQEGDRPNPLNSYGASKWAGEQAVQAVSDRHLILRASWLYAATGPGNFVTTMLRLGRERTEVRVVADQVGTPTYVADLVTAWAQLPPDLGGLYHYCNSGVASWYDLAIASFEEAIALGLPLQVERVVPITTADYPTAAQRPAYSLLATQKLSEILGAPPPHWRESLRQMLRVWAIAPPAQSDQQL